MDEHPPAQARRLIQEAKLGRRPNKVLMDDARRIDDPGHAASTLFFLANSQSVDRRAAAKALEDTLALLGKVDRDWRKGETLDDLARRGPSWREWDDIEGPLAAFQTKLVETAIALDDAGLGKALPGVARWTPDDLLAKLFRRALSSATPMEHAKIVLGYGGGAGIREEIERLPDAAMKARLLGFLHGHSESPMTNDMAGSLANVPPEKALETYRAVIASLERIEDLDAVAKRLPSDPEVKARLLCAIAAKSDKLGHGDKAALRFNEAEDLAKTLEDKRRDAVMKNVMQGRDRLAGKPLQSNNPAAAKARDATTQRNAMARANLTNVTPASKMTATPSKPVAATAAQAMASTGDGTRHILALVGTYEGKLADPHLRAVARAAPLCWAFHLDLAFVGFPGTLADVVKQASKSGIGEGGGYLERLERAGRLHMVSGGDGESKRLAELGHVVATTPQPQPGRSTDFHTALGDARRFGHARLLVMMGLGPKGIPATLLKDAPVHVELTGQNVSLETATAMGIIAERLRQL